MLCFELPTQNTASGPDSLRSARSLSPTSLIACSQLIFWYLPSTSFIGDFRRIEFSWIPCSRTEAPFAQCAPKLSGESNTGSCRVHTPFSTVASTAQPTEQCVQTVRLTSVAPVAPAAASALPMVPYGSWLANAPAPATQAPSVSKTSADPSSGAELPRDGEDADRLRKSCRFSS